ncbi:uncharacterized protein LOC111398307 [Olea europaea var. sylvestris]|uniref:uncharacterized protein LOC111398307 n=1 Tax=Olea europaea var. sylvestris TaxID=158386 RepID=UPI000C1CE780|nr:uncharacterized protein LOC111398307 [Olea europaea var. sylvestris]
MSSRVKLLEDSNQARNSLSESGQERGISTASLPTSSEISEIQDMGTLGKSNILPPVPSAAHARTLRKNSGDQLAIDIDSESERLVNKKEADEDKGHVFKSLNTAAIVFVANGAGGHDEMARVWFPHDFYSFSKESLLHGD